MLLANGFAPAGALNGFAPPPPPPPPPPPNGFAPPEVGADVLNGLTAFELPKGLGLVVVLPVEGANGLGALAPPPPPLPALNVNAGADEGAAVEPKVKGAAAFAAACFSSTVAAEGALAPNVNDVDDAGVDDTGGVTTFGLATVAPNKPEVGAIVGAVAAGAAPNVNVAGFAVSAGFTASSAGFAAPKVNVVGFAVSAGFAGEGASTVVVGFTAPKTKGEDDAGAGVALEVPKEESFVSPSSFFVVSIGVGSLATAPKPVKAGGFASALGAVAKPPPKLKVAGGGLAGSSLFASSFVSSFFGFVDAKKPSKPLFSPSEAADGEATTGDGALVPKVNVGAAAGLGVPTAVAGDTVLKRGADAFAGSVVVVVVVVVVVIVAADGATALGVEPAKVNFAVDGFTSAPLPMLVPSGARK